MKKFFEMEKKNLTDDNLTNFLHNHQQHAYPPLAINMISGLFEYIYIPTQMLLFAMEDAYTYVTLGPIIIQYYAYHDTFEIDIRVLIPSQALPPDRV